MKRLIFFLLIIIGSVFVWSNIKSQASSNDGIQFFEGNWKATLQRAKSENKPIFLDIYATWCGPCKMLKRRSFTDRQVGNFFNANYVSVSFDGETGDGQMLANKFHIDGYPTLIVLDKDGRVIGKQTGFLPPEELLSFGKEYAHRR